MSTEERYIRHVYSYGLLADYFLIVRETPAFYYYIKDGVEKKWRKNPSRDKVVTRAEMDDEILAHRKSREFQEVQQLCVPTQYGTRLSLQQLESRFHERQERLELENKKVAEAKLALDAFKERYPNG